MKKQASASLRNAAVITPKRMSTGIPGLDHVLGADWRTKESGLCVPSTVLLCGANGIGKSTLMLQMAVSIKAKYFMYIHTNTSREQAFDHVTRIGWTDKQISSCGVYEADTLSRVLSFISNNQPEVVVVDAVNELIATGCKAKNDHQASMIYVIEKLAQESRARGIAIFLVCATSTKEDFAAVQRVSNAVSAVMTMKLCPKLGKDVREIGCPTKNRFGSTKTISRFVMTEKGLVPRPESTDDANADVDTEFNKASKQIVLRISPRLHEKLQLALKDKRANNPGQNITQSDVIRTILEKSL